MGKVGNLKRLVVALSATAVVLVVAAVSGAAPGTEASVSTFDQCANDGPPSTSTGCPGNWINGILNAQNSHYAEDDVTPQRVVLELPKNGPTTDRTVEISYLTRKGGVHAYDSLATWNYTQTTADRCANLNAADCVPAPASTLAVPPDSTAVADNNGAGSPTSGHQLSGQNFTLYGGTLTGASAYTHDDASGTSDSYAHITLTYSVPSTANGAKVMLLFGGHIAPGLGPRGWGAGVGAGSISGGPYHIRITSADGGSVGNRDNQIMSGAILSPANIVIRKNTVGGDGTFAYTATGGISSNFNISTTGGTASQSFTNISPGAYTVTESAPPAGWDFTNLVCVDEDDGSSVDLGQRKATIDLDAGETVICTYTNTKRGKIVVDKVTDPSGDAQTFPFTLTGGTDAINQGFSLADASTPHDSGFVKPGTYAASETSVPAGWDLTSSTCSDGSAPASISLDAGEVVTCTFTNTKRAQLTVIKTVVNDDGGSAVSSNWTMNVAGPTPLSFPGAVSPGTTNAVDAGAYKVTETGGPAGYSLSYSGDCDADGDVSLALGQSKTCVLTNNDQAASLTVIKTVVNDDGGSAVSSNWTMNVAGPTPLSFPGAVSPGTSSEVMAGAYKVTESGGPSGYALTYSGDCDEDGDVTVGAGQSKTCVLTNNDQAASLTVIKTVVNDDGGSAVSSNWTMNVAGPTPLSFPGAVSPGTTNAVDAGAYKVTETGGPAGYSLSYSGDCDADGDVSLALGQSKTCVLTNNDQAASLTVIKTVVNDNGGGAVANDFTMTINGVDAVGGNSMPGTADPGVTKTLTSVGQYSVSESSVSGYTQTNASAGCSGTIAVGEHKTCTITNDDLAPTLTLVKEVVNDDGGTALASEWTLAAAGPTGFSGSGPSVSSGPSFDQGTYDLSESGGPAAYDASGWECTRESQSDADTVVLGLGDEVTCTITNDDRPATLIVKKVVVNDNGGTKQAQDFLFQVNQGGAQAFEADGQNDLTVDAGTYEVTEPAVAGYTTTYQGCANIVLPLGGSATCTVTNNDVPRGQGSISVSKSANPTTIKEPGGPVTFSVTITNTSADVNVTIDNVVDDKFGDLDDSGGNGCFDVPINLAPGEKVNCTFQKTITGVGGTTHVNVVTVTGHDSAGHQLTASDDARVDITERRIDLVIVKEASSPTPLNGIVNYSLAVTNKGPDTATNVQLADPAPLGITYLTASPSQGTCNVGPALITCSLGSIAAGQTVTIAITARATTVGPHTNTATVTGGGGRETNAADNVDTAVTVVPAPFTPPTAKPPVVQTEVCLSLTVSPKMIKADGKPDKVKVKVTAGKKAVKGVKVVVRGAGVKKSAKTNGKGVAVLKINPRKPGLITVTVVETNKKLCGPKRIGVVGVFLPPLTG